MTSRIMVLALGSTILSIASAAAGADAQPAPYSGRTVVAQSQFGNGSVEAPVRETSMGLEVRLPGGTWVGCGRDCSETLRLETVDFWEAQNRLTNQCGLLGCLKLQYPK
jgi:hypothetical protein